MPDVRPGEKVAIVGRFQSGKSSAMKFLLESAPAAIVADPRAEFTDPPWTPCRLDDALAVAAKNRHVAVQVKPRRDMDAFAATAYQLRGWVVGLDELGMAIKGVGPQVVEGAIDDLWRLGHKDGTTVMWAAHRWHEVPSILREVEHVLHFRSTVRTDRDAVEGSWGPEAREILENLAPYEYLYIDPTGTPHHMEKLPL